jgi:hypothetical protein
MLLLLPLARAGWAESSHYVSPQGSHRAPYSSWTDAATNIQAAVDVCQSGDTVWVGDGLYVGTEICIRTPISLKSVNGPDATVLQGTGAGRVLSILTDATVDGFTLTGGSAVNGAGAMMLDGTLIRCHVTSNKASQRGGGVYCDRGYPAVRNCVITDNTARYGGGIMFFTTAASKYQVGYAESCLIARNTAELKGGGGYGNLSGDFYNCTIVNNIASNAGGGVFFLADQYSYGLCANSIIYDNEAPSGMNHYNAGAYFFSCCTVPSMGSDCVEEVPQFREPWRGDYRLASSSPCINAADPFWADLGGLDLDGRPRFLGEGIEIGAYESVAEQIVDTDGDGMSDADEVRAGMDPFRADSIFAIQALGTTVCVEEKTVGAPSQPEVITLRWASAEGRSYTVWRSFNLLEGFVAIQSHLVATPPANVYEDALDDSHPSAYYRITVE